MRNCWSKHIPLKAAGLTAARAKSCALALWARAALRDAARMRGRYMVERGENCVAGVGPVHQPKIWRWRRHCGKFFKRGVAVLVICCPFQQRRQQRRGGNEGNAMLPLSFNLVWKKYDMLNAWKTEDTR